MHGPMRSGKKFGLVEAKRVLAFARSRDRQLTQEAVFWVEVAIVSVGFKNTAAAEACADIALHASIASAANRAAGHTVAHGTSRSEAFRRRCDNIVSAVRNTAEKIVSAITEHYRTAISRAQAKEEARADMHFAKAQKAVMARAEAQEIADLF